VRSAQFVMHALAGAAGLYFWAKNT